MAPAAAALIIANSPLAGGYTAALEFKLGGLTLLHWVNDGLMAVFFLLVGLEIKRELLEGQLSSWAAPCIAGVGRGRRHDRTGADFRGGQPGAAGNPARLGNSLDNRHRLCARRSSFSIQVSTRL